MEMSRPAISRTRRSGITPNGPKIREAVLHLIREADQANLRPSQFDILKAMFIADREHLNKYGRPITFDEYVAMKDGPVASLTYDLLKEKSDALREVGLDRPLWKTIADGATKKIYYDAERDASDDILSESDKEELSEALRKVKNWGYNRTWKHVHDDPSYIDAWSKRSGALQHPMNIALLMSNPDQDYADDLKFISAHL